MVGYVILHYQNENVSKQCISSLLASSKESPIVVVDNASPNGSGKRLQSYYAAEKRIVVLLNEANLGFAKGNNVGFAYLKKHFNPDYIVVLNNDVIITDLNFENVLTTFMQQNNLDVCGPDILTPTGKHQNPLLPATPSTHKLIVQMLADEVRMLLLKMGILQKQILAFYNRSSASHHKVQVTENVSGSGVLHGACIAYSKRYLQSANFAFLPLTFLYAEEFLLADYLHHRHFSSGICTATSVKHLGGVSTATELSDKQKLMFKTHQMNKSLCIVLWQRLKYICK